LGEDSSGRCDRPVYLNLTDEKTIPIPVQDTSS
jgi:hypothetical protein